MMTMTACPCSKAEGGWDWTIPGQLSKEE